MQPKIYQENAIDYLLAKTERLLNYSGDQNLSLDYRLIWKKTIWEKTREL